MSVVLRTPPLNRMGLYILRAPWSADAAQVYTCKALRTFDDCVKLGIDVFNTYYVPYSQTQEVYNEDKAAGATIVTLMSEKETIYVPDSFIEHYPDMTAFTYQNVVLSIGMGAIPDYLDLTFLSSQLAGSVSDVLGVVPTVLTHVAPSAKSMTADQHEIAEAARTAAIRTRVTDRAKLLIAQGEVTALQLKVDALTKLCKDHNLLT